MIPHRIQFSGIRDFLPSSLDLSGDGHIMITGPNGSGKSTLTFCMGAALYSSKVDIEGLRSQNLPPEEVWRAHVSLLFKNEGPMKIDEPAFIQFTIFIVQEPGQPIKREFIIQKGEHPDEWQDTIKYTSGDRYYNFSAYKKDLQFRYKIHPDIFYLIWYQQEVNQFAVMYPEERFRIFSQMHGIDKMQKNWEESIDKVQDAEETMQSAELNIKHFKQKLNFLKTELNRLVDNQKRLRNGALDSIEALQHLELLYKKEIKSLKGILDDLEGQLENNQDNFTSTTTQKDNSIQELKRLENQYEKLDEVITNISQQLETENNQLTSTVTEKDDLELELEGLIANEQKIERTEEEAHRVFNELTLEKAKNEQEQKQLKADIKDKTETNNELTNKIATLSAQIKQDERLNKQHQERLNRFGSSFKVQEKIQKLHESAEQNRNLLRQINQEVSQLKNEEKALEEDRNVSHRQQQSLDYFHKSGVDAYPLRELIELDASAILTDEKHFDAIKYAIFFNSKTALPPNDLYHVPLMDIVPDRWTDHLPEIHLKVRADLPNERHNHAVKALFWVSQFFKSQNPLIKGGIVIDARGMRGPQEKQTYILSQKAIQNRLKEIGKETERLSKQSTQLSNEIKVDMEQFQLLNSEIQKVKEAEAFMTKLHEREQQKEMLAATKEEYEFLKTAIEQHDQTLYLFMQEQATLNEQLIHVQKELDFYKELGKSKVKYEKLQQLKKLAEETKGKIKLLETERDNKETESGELERSISKKKRKIDKTTRQLEDIQREQDQLITQEQREMERLETYENALVHVIKALQDMKQLVPELYTEFTALFTEETSHSEEALNRQLQHAKIVFNTAREEVGIDPAAKENYEKAQEEYERLDNEYKQSRVLLEADKERTEKLRTDLETTINMRVLEIQKRFTIYMGEFQFQSDINWDSVEDKKGRTTFRLYIKARKEGHRGTMEDVSFKARGGKVGKGVSGGEESLSSLLFALALLQNLNTSPGFIVFDEFDSALDEHRKSKVFDLFVEQLQRKLIILSPKTHEEEYIDRFQKAFVVQHDPRIPRSKVTGLIIK